MGACDYTFGERATTLLATRRGASPTRVELWRGRTATCWSVEVPAGADLRALVDTDDAPGPCCFWAVRGHAATTDERCALVSDLPTGLVLMSGVGVPVIAGPEGCTALMMSAGSTSREHTPRSGVGCRGVLTEPADHLAAALLVATHTGGDRASAAGAEANEEIEAVVARLLATMLGREPEPLIASTGVQPPIAAVRRDIARCVDREVTLRTLAQTAGWSPWYLSRRFSAEVGLPVHRYLTRARLRLALHRILHTSDGLAGIATDVGFSSHSHFTSAFRQEFATTPLSLRQILAGARHHTPRPEGVRRVSELAPL
jgi:AraC-like DNA-binding protein